MNSKLESRISRLEKLLLKSNCRVKNEQILQTELSTLQHALTDLGNAQEKLGSIGLLSMDLKANAAKKFNEAYNSVQNAIDNLALLLDELGVYNT